MDAWLARFPSDQDEPFESSWGTFVGQNFTDWLGWKRPGGAVRWIYIGAGLAPDPRVDKLLDDLTEAAPEILQIWGEPTLFDRALDGDE